MRATMLYLRGGARRAALILGAIGVLSMLGVLRAGAQIDIIPKIRLKAGVFLPQNSSLKDAVGDVWFKAGADVTIPVSFLPLGSTRLGIEGAFRDSSTLIPVTLTEVFQPSAIVARSPLYVGAGIGLWTAHVRGSGTATRFGFRLLGGLDLTNRFFTEVQYDFVDRIGGIRADGLSVLVGMKF